MRNRTLVRPIPRGVLVLLALVIAFAVPSLAFGHVVVFPKSSAAGAHERYVLRVPNEKAVATTRVELRVPAEVRVTAFAEAPGWSLKVLTDTANRIIGAVWTGSLAPKRFAEFAFVAANPKEPGTLSWAAYQTYDGGERVEWTGVEGSRTPASVTTITSSAIGDIATRAGGAPAWVAWTALLVAFASLGLALRRPERAA